MKISEGAHGGQPAVQLPGSIAIDYWVNGTCDFTLVVSPATGNGTPVATFDLRVGGTPKIGTWTSEISPGTYYVSAGEAVGCAYTFAVRPRT